MEGQSQCQPSDVHLLQSVTNSLQRLILTTSELTVVLAFNCLPTCFHVDGGIEGKQALLISTDTLDHEDITLILLCASSTAGLNLGKHLKIRRYWLCISAVDSLSISIPICHSIVATVLPFLITEVVGDPWQVKKDYSSGLLIVEWLRLAGTSGGCVVQPPCSSRAT